jgi:TolB protein
MLRASSICLVGVVSLCGWANSHESAHYEIAFASFAPLNTDIFIADADGNNAKALFADPDLDSNASFSKDGRWIVFTSRRGGSSNIYRGHPDGTALEVLVNDPAFDDQAALSPDGKHLAYYSATIPELMNITGARRIRGTTQIVSIDVQSGEQSVLTSGPGEKLSPRFRRLTTSPGNDAHSAWSRDGEWLAFTSVRQGFKDEAVLHIGNPQPGGEICVMHADGSDLRVLTDDQYEEGTPTWVTQQSNYNAS